MAIDDEVRELLHVVTPSPDVTVDVDVVRRNVRRRRSRIAVVAAALSVAVVVGGVSAVALSSAGDQPPPSERPPDSTLPDPPHTPGWHRLPAMPLSPRWGSLTAWTSEEFLVMGGYRQHSVGGVPPFENLKDGAAFDPDIGTWRKIAAAPVELSEQMDSILVGDSLVVVHWDGWLVYDIGDDSWRPLPTPPRELQQVSLAPSADDPDVVYALDPYLEESRAPVQVLDLATEQWSELPLSPHRPALNQRTIVATPEGLVVVAEDYRPRQAGRHQLEDAHAEIWDGHTWTRYGDSEVRGCCWHWTGERIVATSRYDRRSGALDPATGDWSRLPQLPQGRPRRLLDAGWPVADGPMVFGNGYLYDDTTGTSRPVLVPRQAAQNGALELGDGRLMMFGGYRVAPGQEGFRVMDVEPTREAWVYIVP